ncbi:MAG: FG-GAP repeat domain-containing protein [Planctomycetaceae bacterium]
MKRISLIAVAILFAAQTATAAFPKFKTTTIDPRCGNVCYAVTVADVNGDKKTDIVAVTENRVLWYENPTWKKHVILENQTLRDNVCIAPHDVDGDGKVDFALGAGWTKAGTIQWITRGKSPGELWSVHLIGKERWLHRMRFADVLGTGKPQLVISPLNATVGKGVRLTAFEIPKHPKTGRWKPHVLDATLNRMHNHWHTDLNRDGVADTLTASREGIHLITKGEVGFKKTKLADGAKGKTPNAGGAGEIKLGTLAKGRRFIATVQPMHGNMLVVNVEQRPGNNNWKRRHVLTSDLVRGHALWVADFDGDGSDEILIGHSNTSGGDGKPRGLYIYRAYNSVGIKWNRHVVDEGGIAVEDAIVADFNGDGKPDIVAGGRYTHNIKLYVNQGP